MVESSLKQDFTVAFKYVMQSNPGHVLIPVFTKIIQQSDKNICQEIEVQNSDIELNAKDFQSVKGIEDFIKHLDSKTEPDKIKENRD